MLEWKIHFHPTYPLGRKSTMKIQPFTPSRGVLFAAAVVATYWLTAGTRQAPACPFCSATSQTLSEEMASADVAVLAKLVQAAPAPKPSADDPAGFAASDPDTGLATFAVQEVLRGKDHAEGLDQIKVVYFGSGEKNKNFLISGMAGQQIDWTTPLPLSKGAVSYVKQLGSLPQERADRLEFFLGYLENEDPLLAQDAYDEFARAPYNEVMTIRDRIDRQRLVRWIHDPRVGPTRRRLYLTMLGVCGQAEDIEMLEALLRYDYQQLKPGIAAMVSVMGLNGSALGVPIADELVRADVRRKKQCLDALVAAYLRLKVPSGLALIDKLFLSNPQAEYTHVYATIMALRFHGEETDTLPRERLMQSMRLVLDNEEIADQVIPDLARWEDWSILDRLVTMFKSSEKDAWIRQPVVSYLLTAEEQPAEVGQNASKALAELEQLDPEGVKRARSYMAFGLLARGRPKKNDVQQDTPKPDPNPGDTKEVVQETAEKADAEATQPVVEAKPVVAKATAVEKPAVSASSDQPSAIEPASATDKTAATPPVVDSPRVEGPSRFMILGVPLVAGLLMMGIFSLLLRGVDPRSDGGEEVMSDR